ESLPSPIRIPEATTSSDWCLHSAAPRGPAAPTRATGPAPADCPPRPMPPSFVLDQNDASGDQGRPLRSFDLHGRFQLDAYACRLLRRLDERHAQPDAAADLNRRQEAHAVVAVVETPPPSADRED